MKFNLLKTLDLSHNPLGDQGIKYLTACEFPDL